MASSVRYEREGQRRRRELTDSLEFGARVARDPVMARRVEDARARIAAGDVDEDDLVSYVELSGRIDEFRRHPRLSGRRGRSRPRAWGPSLRIAGHIPQSGVARMFPGNKAISQGQCGR